VEAPKYLVIHHTATIDTVQKDIVDRAHQRKFNDRSFYGSYILYHILIGKDGTVVYNRGLNERTGHTRNNEINLSSIAIALAGNFNEERPTSSQLNSLRAEIKKLNDLYKFEKIIPHQDASPTACAGKYLNSMIRKEYGQAEKKFVLSRYYTPVRNQPYYYRNYEGAQLFDKALEHGVIRKEGNQFIYDGQLLPVQLGQGEAAIEKLKGSAPIKQMIKSETEYRAEFKVNCMGDCRSTASTYYLDESDAYSVVACPPNYPFGTKFVINNRIFICYDRGGMIDENSERVRLDIWSGIGKNGLDRIRSTPVPENPTVEIIYP
jgi:hypothetical protein